MIDDTISKKIKSLDELSHVTAKLRRDKKAVVHCHGVFDLVHLGHIRYFYGAKKEGDILVVTLTADQFVKRGPGRPIFNEQLRAEQVACLEVVDYVAIVPEATALSAIRAIRPAVYAKGPDYQEKHKDITGMITAEEKAVRAVGGKLVITHDITFSSSNLLNTFFDNYPEATRAYLRRLARNFSIDKIMEYLDASRNLKVLVIGDAIIDQYHYCAPLGKSSKEPLIVHLYDSHEDFCGGALASANHVAQVTPRTHLVSVLGKRDSWQDFINNHLEAPVRAKYFMRPDANTTIKRRYISSTGNRKVFEVCYMNDKPISPEIEKKIQAHLRASLPKVDLVVVNDFGHGFLTPGLINTISRGAKKLAVNVQTNSANMGFNLITKYPRADFVCIDEQELRFATHDKQADIKVLIKREQKQLRSRLIITTRGSKGSMSYAPGIGFTTSPALTPRVVDPVGAGDAFFAYTAPCFASGVPVPVICFIGNVVGALAVQIVGNRSAVKKVDVIKFMTRLLK